MKNTAEIKKENQRRIWEILRDGLPHTKQEAARITGLSPATCNTILNEQLYHRNLCKPGRTGIYHQDLPGKRRKRNLVRKVGKYFTGNSRRKAVKIIKTKDPAEIQSACALSFCGDFMTVKDPAASIRGLAALQESGY